MVKYIRRAVAIMTKILRPKRHPSIALRPSDARSRKIMGRGMARSSISVRMFRMPTIQT